MNARRSDKREVMGIAALFGAIYFIQGMSEPTEGLIAQPVRSLLNTWGHSVAEIAVFSAVLSAPWSLKPIFGLLSDFFPLAGSRRRSYLIVMSTVSLLGLGYLFINPPEPGSVRWLLAFLMLPTIGVAFSDVVADALMVEHGQRWGITGQLQSVQWAAMYAAMIITGSLGGYLSQHRLQHIGFLICAALTGVTLILALFFVRESERPARQPGFWEVAKLLGSSLRNPALLSVAAFIFLWNYNPFSMSVLQLHMTRALNLSELFYGRTISLFAVGSVVASISYGLVCRRVPFRWLIHISICVGVLSTLAYWGLKGPRSAVVISVVVGWAYTTGNLIQLDLAARVCPSVTAGTMFAILMALANLSILLAESLGGFFYQGWSNLWGSGIAFNLLVALGATFTAACWFLVPMLRKQHEVWQTSVAAANDVTPAGRQEIDSFLTQN